MGASGNGMEEENSEQWEYLKQKSSCCKYSRYLPFQALISHLDSGFTSNCFNCNLKYLQFSNLYDGDGNHFYSMFTMRVK